MRIADAEILFLPGDAPPPADHWQTRWAAKFSTGRLIADQQALGDALAIASRPVIFIAHGNGVAAMQAIARAPASPASVAGAFIVAPRAGDHLTPEPLPFPALVIASETDPHTPPEQAFALAQGWGAAYRSAGDAGALDDASGHGPWPEGLMIFGGFLKGLG